MCHVLAACVMCCLYHMSGTGWSFPCLWATTMTSHELPRRVCWVCPSQGKPWRTSWDYSSPTPPRLLPSQPAVDWWEQTYICRVTNSVLCVCHVLLVLQMAYVTSVCYALLEMHVFLNSLSRFCTNCMYQLLSVNVWDTFDISVSKVRIEMQPTTCRQTLALDVLAHWHALSFVLYLHCHSHWSEQCRSWVSFIWARYNYSTALFLLDIRGYRWITGVVMFVS